MNVYSLSVNSSEIILIGTDDAIIEQLKATIADIRKLAPEGEIKLSCNASIELRTCHQHRDDIFFKELISGVKKGEYGMSCTGFHISIEQWLAIYLAIPQHDEPARNFHQLLRSRLFSRPPKDLCENPQLYPDLLAKAQLLLHCAKHPLS